MNTGLDQLVLNQIVTLSQFVEEKEFLAEDKTEIYAINCLKRALESALNYLHIASLKDKQISELGDHITKLDVKIREIANHFLDLNLFKNEIGSLLALIEENTRLNDEPLADPLMKDVVVFEKSEFGDRFDHLLCDLMYKNDVPYLNPGKRTYCAPIKFKSKLLPGFAHTEEEYEKILKQYVGVVDILPIEKLRALIDDLNINLPSNSLILPQRELVPVQVLVDLPRLSKLIINGESLLNSESKANKEALFCDCLRAMGEDVDVALAVMKLITQATLARPTYILYTGFQYAETMTRVSQALDVIVSIRTQNNDTPMPFIEIKMWGYFGMIRGEDPEPFAYVGVMRRLSCSREFLVSGAKGKDMGEVIDVYSKLYPRLMDLRRCNFDLLGDELKKAKLILGKS